MSPIYYIDSKLELLSIFSSTPHERSLYLKQNKKEPHLTVNIFNTHNYLIAAVTNPALKSNKMNS